MKKRIIIIVTALVVVLCLVLVVVMNQSEDGFGERPAQGSGKILISDDTIEMKLKNIFLQSGKQIDYLSNIDINGENDYEITVDSSAVNVYEPGEYTATYKVECKDNVSYQTVMVKVQKNDGDLGSENTQNENTTHQDSNAQTVHIELQNGGTADILCTTKRYITDTRTEQNSYTKKGVKYESSQLIVEFSTGETQVLETIEKKID